MFMFKYNFLWSFSLTVILMFIDFRTVAYKKEKKSIEDNKLTTPHDVTNVKNSKMM